MESRHTGFIQFPELLGRTLHVYLLIEQIPANPSPGSPAGQAGKVTIRLRRRARDYTDTFPWTLRRSGPSNASILRVEFKPD